MIICFVWFEMISGDPHSNISIHMNEAKLDVSICNNSLFLPSTLLVSDHNGLRKNAAAKLIQSYWRFYSYIKANREQLAWKRIRQVARLKKLKNHLYTSLHEWREHKKINCMGIYIFAWETAINLQ
jgi:hypothetical protein